MKKQYKVSETKGDVQEIAETHTYLSGTSTNFINLLEQRKTLIILIRVVVKGPLILLCQIIFVECPTNLNFPLLTSNQNKGSPKQPISMKH